MSLDAAAHRAQVEAWRARREARYRSATGWLSLVDRIPLEEGENATPIGTLIVDGASVRLRVADGAPVTRGGRPITGDVLLAVRDAAAPAEPLERDGRIYEVVGRPGHMSVRVRDPQARALREFPGIPFFEIDLRWRITSSFEPLDPPAVEMVPRTDGIDLPTPRVGTARFELDGAEHALAVYHEESSGRWFIPFTDATSGQETYGAGRSLYVERPGPGEPLVIDFNLAFNLPCAFNWLVACPVPPAHNRLAIAVRAGERTPPWSAPLDEP